MSIRSQFANASPVRQAAIVLAGVLLLGCLAALAFYTLVRPVYQPAFSNLQPSDAAMIVAELEKRKLPYRLEDGGRVILLPAERADAIRLEIMGSDLPLKGAVGFELFNKSDMGLTDFAQKINYQRALQGELARTILAMDGVESVRVHLALGEDRLFREDRVPPKASVLVRMKNEAAIPASTAQGMQRLVAAAVDKLDPANVVILGEAGEVASITPASMLVDASPIGQERRAIEAYYEARIHKAIDKAYPHEPISVRVWADLRNDSGTAEGAADMAAWSPENRQFRLHVNLAPDRVLAAGAMQDIEQLAANAVDLNPSLGDAISFGAAPSAAVSPEAAPRPPAPSASPPAEAAAAQHMETGTTSLIFQIIVLLASGLLFGAAAVWLLQRRRRRLDPKMRMDFADRLAQLLRDEEGDHAGRSI